MFVDGEGGGEEVEDPFPLSTRSASAFLLSSKKSYPNSEMKKMGLLNTISFKVLKFSKNDVVLIDLV